MFLIVQVYHFPRVARFRFLLVSYPDLATPVFIYFGPYPELRKFMKSRVCLSDSPPISPSLPPRALLFIDILRGRGGTSRPTRYEVHDRQTMFKSDTLHLDVEFRCCLRAQRFPALLEVSTMSKD
jgi:hypothetical protein